jgi:NDP-sugar pyrophosphorylase family protein
VPLLERNARRLVAAGADRLVVNCHRFPDQFEAWRARFAAPGVEVLLSLERDRPLETGGGLARARSLLRGEGPVLVHNADLWTDLSLADLLEAHARSGALATLAVMDRPTSRRLLFDDDGLCGRADDARGLRRTVRPPAGPVREWGFSGVHAAGRDLLARLPEGGPYSLVDAWLDLAAQGARLAPHRVDGCAWIDVGRPADLERAERLARAAGTEGAGAPAPG